MEEQVDLAQEENHTEPEKPQEEIKDGKSAHE